MPLEVEPVLKKPPEPSPATKETERQLSKKELKKKGLEELEAVLAELGLQTEPSGQDDSHGNMCDFFSHVKNYFKYISSFLSESEICYCSNHFGWLNAIENYLISTSMKLKQTHVLVHPYICKSCLKRIAIWNFLAWNFSSGL